MSNNTITPSFKGAFARVDNGWKDLSKPASEILSDEQIKDVLYSAKILSGLNLKGDIWVKSGASFTGPETLHRGYSLFLTDQTVSIFNKIKDSSQKALDFINKLYKEKLFFEKLDIKTGVIDIENLKTII